MEAKSKRGSRPASGAQEPTVPAAVDGAAVVPPAAGVRTVPVDVAPAASARPEAGAPADPFNLFGEEALTAFASSQAALARGLEALSGEMIGFARAGFDTAMRAASGMLGVKTVADAMEINAGCARNGMDAFLGASARLTAIAVTLAGETAQPLIGQFGKGWGGPGQRPV